MKNLIWMLWPATFVVVVLLAFIVGYALVAFVVGAILATILIVLYDGFFSIPAKKRVVLLLFEDFYKVLSPGAHIVFPYFSIFSLAKDSEGDVLFFPDTIDDLPVFEREKIVQQAKNNESTDLTEFKDLQAFLIATLYFRVANVKVAFLERDNYLLDLQAWFKSLLRDYCKDKNLVDIDTAKDNVGLDELLSIHFPDWEEKTSREEAEQWAVENNINCFVKSGKAQKVKYVYLYKYGIWLENFLLEDIILPHDIEDAQRQQNIATARQKVAEVEAETAEIVAKGQKQAWAQNSESWENAYNKLITLGVGPKEATEVISQNQHWQGAQDLEKIRGEWISKSGTKPTIILGDRNAQLGASAKAGGAAISND